MRGPPALFCFMKLLLNLLEQLVCFAVVVGLFACLLWAVIQCNH